MLSAPHACPDFHDLEFHLDGFNGQDDVKVSVKSSQYSTYEDGVCSVLFKPSNSETGSFGMALLEEYIISFDLDDSRIGFTVRDYQGDKIVKE